MKLASINRLLAVVIVVGLVVMLLQRLPPKKNFTKLINSVASPQETVSRTNVNEAMHYAPDENLEGMEVGVLDHAKKDVDVAMYSFTDKTIERELEKLAKHGVRVRLYRDREQYEQEKQRAQETGVLCVTDELAGKPNVEVKVKASLELMHEKDFVVDGEILRTGSANWSIGGLRKQDNVVLYARSVTEARRFTQKFQDMWERSDNDVVP